MPIQSTQFKGVFIHTPTPEQASATTPQARQELSRKNQAFIERNESTLEQLASQRSGRALLGQIESIHAMAPRKRVVITPSNGEWPQSLSCEKHPETGALRPMNQWPDIDTYMSRRPSTSQFMPEVAAIPLPGREVPGSDEVWIATDPAIGMKFSSAESDDYELSPDHYVATLGHEMIHARDSLHGIQPRRAQNEATAEDEAMGRPLHKALLPVELRTVGIGQYADEIPSENSIRREHGLTERRSYHGFTREE
ncbi:M91 family zinc metallopeptidase [Paracidovorax konjaci]|uniref:Effector protein n=1 Tax=Paracidovorax konjaci TaxID=32040 RepID=A0A1I1XHU1_9BURK|nr:M91 family zinc metallopeptidase [Paracidovorax konjaci]SFE06761.1 Effector protein [Paracidovorax konjaci]